LAIQPDGKILVAGTMGPIGQTSARGVVLRLNTSGLLDISFAGSGIAAFKFGPLGSTIAGIALQSDGKIVVAGTAQLGDSELLRLNSDGSLDTAFGSGGTVNLFPSALGPVALQSNGGIVLVMQVVNPSSVQMRRYDTNGQLDTTFGTGGIAPLVFGGTAMAVQGDDKILVASNGASGSVLTRYTISGALDTSYGISGQASAMTATAITLQRDGQVVAAGTVTRQPGLNFNSTGFGVVRIGTNGVADTTFGVHGGVVTAFSNLPVTGANTVAIQGDGKIVAAGGAGVAPQSTEYFALARYFATGQTDITFGLGGTVTTKFGDNVLASISAVGIQSDGKIIAAGGTSAGNFVVARYLGQ
jgi:uncharacterized delta-60 repeat protein